MNNTEKKLDALIDALGFDVVETPVFMARPDGGDKVHIRTDIKLTKRNKPVRDCSVTGNDFIDSLDVSYDDVSLRQLVENINQLSELDKDYRWIKYPLDSYYAVYGHFSSKMIIWSCKNYFEALGVKVMLDEM
jgi:hypothetical protein